MSRGAKPEEYSQVIEAAIWPYTTAAGYPEVWYGPKNKLDVLQQHPLYRKDYYYREDAGLTIKGVPHNRVLGIIRRAGDPAPREARHCQSGYDWTDPAHREELIDLSSAKYPILVEPKHSGELWVVINDVDEVRYDNGGMFFLKLTQNAWRR